MDTVQYDPNTGQKLSQGQTVSFGGKSFTQGSSDIYGTTISPNTLKSTTSIQLPPTTPPNYSSIEGAIGGAVAMSEADKERQDFMAQRQTESDKILSLMTDVGQEGALTNKYAMEEGAIEAKKQYKDLGLQITAEQKALRDNAENFRKTFTGLTAGTTAGLDKMQRESLSKQADLAILQMGASNQYETAMEIAKTKVDMELAPKKAELEGLKYIMENNKWANQMELQSIYDRKKRELDKEEADKTASQEMILNALQSGAPTSLTTKAQDLFNQGKSKMEIARTLGDYSLSSADRLDLEIKRLNKEKLSKEISEIGVGSDKLLSVTEAQAAGVPYGTTESQLMAMGGEKPFNLKTATESLSNLTWLVDTAEKAVNNSKKAGISNFRQWRQETFRGATPFTELQANADSLKTNLLTMAVDPAVKKFFGPQMSEADVRMMMAGGTTLDPKRQSEEEFKAEAQRVLNFMQRAKKAVEDGIKAENLNNYIDSSGTALQVVGNPLIKNL